MDITLNDIEHMKNIDIKTVDPEQLVDIRSISIDLESGRSAGIADFISQIGNPYCFKYGDFVVKTGYSGSETTLTDRLKEYIASVSTEPF